MDALFEVFVGEDSEEDSIHTGLVREDAHRSGASSDLNEFPLYGIGGPDHVPQRRIFYFKEGEELFLTGRQRCHRFGIRLLPGVAEFPDG